MTPADIKAWLQNPSREYKFGLAIYHEYKINNKFDSFFNGVDSPDPGSMQFKMLVQRVGEISRKLEQNPNMVKPDPITVKPINVDELKKKYGGAIAPIDSKRPRVVDNPLIDASKLPPELQAAYFENKKLTKEISQLHEELKKVPNLQQAKYSKDDKFNAKRKEMAEKLTQKDDQRHANWEKIDAWWSENMLKTDEQKQEFAEKKESFMVSMKEAKAILMRIDNLKIAIPRSEKELKANPGKKDKLQPKIEAWKKELAELEEKVK